MEDKVTSRKNCLVKIHNITEVPYELQHNIAEVALPFQDPAFKYL